jgi:hypothetical protein
VVFQVVHLSFTIRRLVFGFWFLVFGFSSEARNQFPAEPQRGTEEKIENGSKPFE